MSLTNPTFLVDGTTFTSKNVATAASVYQYTVGADGIIYISFAMTVAGNGDYVVYITHKWLTAGSTYTVLPKTTGTAASGETTVSFTSGPIIVKNTDVIDIMVDGLAGDTSIGGIVRIAYSNFSVLEAADNIGINWADVANPTTNVNLSGTTVKTVTDGVTIGATQGAITWGQQKIVANAASEGALDITNSNALGYGTRNNALAIGQYNIGSGAGSAGQTNQGVAQGQHNSGATGQQNDGGAVGQYNTGTTYGAQNTGASGQVNVGTAGDGIYASGTDYGIQATGVTGDIDPDLTSLLTGVNVTSISNDAITAAALATDAADEIADHVWDEAIAGHAAAGSTGATLSTAASAGGATPASLWSYASRTLTQSAAAVQAAVSGSNISIWRGDTVTIALTDIGALTAYTKLDFIVKASRDDADNDALIWVRKTLAGTDDGMKRLNGAAGTAAQGSIVINDAATGDITITLAAAATAQLAPSQCYYDVQMITATTVQTMTDGRAVIGGDVTRATS